MSANSLFHDHHFAVCIFREVLTWYEADHVSVFVGTRYAHRRILRIQDEGPAIGCVTVLEERNTVSSTGNRLITGLSVDVRVVLHLT